MLSLYRVIVSRLAIANVFPKVIYRTATYFLGKAPTTVLSLEMQYFDIHCPSFPTKLHSVSSFMPNDLLGRYCLISRAISLWGIVAPYLSLSIPGTRCQLRDLFRRIRICSVFYQLADLAHNEYPPLPKSILPYRYYKGYLAF